MPKRRAQPPLEDPDNISALFQGGGEVLKEWGANVRARRELCKLDRAQLAGLTGTTVATIGRVEGGQLNPRDHLKVRIARSLAIEPHDLFPLPATAVA